MYFLNFVLFFLFITDIGTSYGINSTPLSDLPEKTVITAWAEDTCPITDRLCNTDKKVVLSNAQYHFQCPDTSTEVDPHKAQDAISCDLVTFYSLNRVLCNTKTSETIKWSLPKNPTIDDLYASMKTMICDKIKVCKMDFNVGRNVYESSIHDIPRDAKIEDLPEERIIFELSMNFCPTRPINSEHLHQITVNLRFSSLTTAPIVDLRGNLPSLRKIAFESFGICAYLPQIQFKSPDCIIESPPTLLCHAGNHGMGYGDIEKLYPGERFLLKDESCKRPTNTFNIYGATSAPQGRQSWRLKIFEPQNAIDTQSSKLCTLPDLVLEHIVKYLDLIDGEALQSAIGREIKADHTCWSDYFWGCNRFLNKSVYMIFDKIATVKQGETAALYVKGDFGTRILYAGPLYAEPLEGKKLELDVDSGQQASHILSQLLRNDLFQRTENDATFITDIF